jgi:hypothetical protein
MRNVYKIWVESHKFERDLGRINCRRGDNINMDFRQVGCDDVDQIVLVQNTEQ